MPLKREIRLVILVETISEGVPVSVIMLELTVPPRADAMHAKLNNRVDDAELKKVLSAGSLGKLKAVREGG